MKYIVDIETDAFLKDVTKVHCLVARKVDDPDKVYLFADVEPGGKERPAGSRIADGVRFLDGQEWVGHNLLGFDIPVLAKLGYDPRPSKVFDTLARSNLFWPELKFSDIILRKTNPKFPTKLIGRHSLKAWGYRFGVLKGDFGEEDNAFQEVTQELIEYCIQDTLVNLMLWRHEEEFQAKQKWPEASCELEQPFMRCISQMMERGFRFDVAGAEKLTADLQVIRAELRQKLDDFPAFAPFVKTWKTPKKGLVRTKLIPFNPDSPKQLARALIERCGWEPVEFTDAGAPKTDAASIEQSGLSFPGFKELRDYIDVGTTLSALAEGDGAWLKLVKPDGRIHQYVNHNGTPTARCRHASPPANAPKVRIKKLKQADGTTVEKKLLGVDGKFGVEFRRLIIPAPGKVLVGCDASGLELRGLAHYMAKYDDGEYARILLESDIHEANRVAAGFDSRDQAKTFIYAFLYGAGDAKIGRIIGGTREDGKRIRAEFIKNFPALGRVIKSMHDAVLKRGQAERYCHKGVWRIKLKPGAFLIGLDGRHLMLRSEHAMLNTLLQSFGAVVVKKSTILMHERIPDFEMVLHYHDEVQSECRPEVAEETGKTMAQSITDAGLFFNLRCPLAGEYKIGRNWAETH